MKNLFTLIILGLTPFLLQAQTPQTINYQAVVRDTGGTILTEIDTDFTIDVLQNGSLVYYENHFNINTGKLGIVNFQLGSVNPDEFSQIDWSLGQIQVRIKVNNEQMGISDIVAVPYSFYAESSGDDGDWINVGDSILYVDNHQIGIGTSSPQSRLHIRNDPDVSLDGGGGFLIGSITGDNLAMDRNEIMARDGGAASRLHFQADGGEIRIHGTQPEDLQVAIKSNGNVGIGEADPDLKLHVVEHNGDAQVMLQRTGTNSGHSTIGGSGNGFIVGHFEGGAENGTFHRDFTVNHDGMGELDCLKINGGCDIKEDLNSMEELEPGDVVVIDEKNPGNIRRTTEIYDRKVAGVISGANGINSGLSLSQKDVLEGGYPLAMLGRVYVKVIGEVEIGDMLTTSSKPGHAMAVKKHKKAMGSVIGKAMTANENGDGMVLVLVNLQ